MGRYQPKKPKNPTPLSFNPFSNETTPLVMKKDDDINFNKLVSLLEAYKKARCAWAEEQQARWFYKPETKCCDHCALADYEQGFCHIDELLDDIERFRSEDDEV